MINAQLVRRSQIYQSILESCLVAPLGMQIGDALIGSFERAVSSNSLTESANLRRLINSVGARLRPEFMRLSDMDLSRYLARGLFLYDGVISDLLGVALSSTEMMETDYLEKYQLVSEIRYLSIALCETQQVGTIDAHLLQPWSFNDLVWRRSLSWVTAYDEYHDARKTSLLIKSIKLGLNVHEGDFMIRPRFRGMRASDLKTVLLRCSTGMQTGLSSLSSLLHLVLTGLNRVVAKIDSGMPDSVLDRDEAFSRLYYACCQLADTLESKPGSFEYLLQKSKGGEWITKKRTGSPSWTLPPKTTMPPSFVTQKTTGFVSQITSSGTSGDQGWRYVRSAV